MDDQLNLYDETSEMLELASLMYLINELRVIAREADLTDSDKIMTTPFTAADLDVVVRGNREMLEEKKYRVQILLDTVATMDQATTFVTYDDKHTDDELLYAIAVHPTRKHVTVLFRGSVTANDWKADLSALQQRDKVELDEGGSTEENLRLHSGFYNYLFKETSDQEITKYRSIVNMALTVLEQNPGFSLHVSGHSLGGALCTLFAFYAALEPELPKPISCFSFASPKVGTMAFRNLFKSLEEKGDLRCLRTANHLDAVTGVPRDLHLVLPTDRRVLAYLL